jgi:hypothetical protein
VKSGADQLDYLSGITSSRWPVSTTKTASSFAGAVMSALPPKADIKRAGRLSA